MADESHDKKTIRIFASASFLNDLGSDMIYPIWPLFITSILGANMAVLGLLDGLGDAIVSLSQAGAGYMSDRLKKRKPFIWIGYLFGSLSRVGYALSTAWQQVLPFRIIDRAGKIRSAPRDAFVADLSKSANRGQNFGLLRAMDNLGAVFGVIVCIFLFEPLGYRNLFFLAAIPSAVGALLILVTVNEGKAGKNTVFKGIRFRELSLNFKVFLGISALFALSSFSYSFLLVYARHFGFKPTFVPVLYLIYTAVASAASIPFGRLADQWGRKWVYLLSLLLWALVCLSFILFQQQYMIIFAFILYGLHLAALEPVQKTIVSELAPAELKASSLGIYQMIIGLCALPASLIAGILWDHAGVFAPFYLSLLLTFMALVGMFFVQEPPKITD